MSHHYFAENATQRRRRKRQAGAPDRPPVSGEPDTCPCSKPYDGHEILCARPPVSGEPYGRMPGGECRFCHAIGVHYEGCPAKNVCHHGNGLSCRECQYEAEAEDATWD